MQINNQQHSGMLTKSLPQQKQTSSSQSLKQLKRLVKREATIVVQISEKKLSTSSNNLMLRELPKNAKRQTPFANMQMKEEWAGIRSRTSHKRFIDALQNILRILNTTNLPQVTYRTVLTDDLIEFNLF